MSKTEKVNPYDIAEDVKKKMFKKTKKTIEKKNVKLAKLNIAYMDIDLLKPNDWNPNRQDEHDFELLCKSMEEDGFTQPIIIHSGTNIIVDGEHRWRAAKVLGFKEIPVVKVDMPIEQMKLSTIRHNRARGHHDIELEAEILKDLEKLGALAWAQDSLMLSDKDLEKLLEDVEAPEVMANEDFSQSWEPVKVPKDTQNVENTKVKDSGGNDILVSSTKESVDKMSKMEEEIKTAKLDEEKEMVKKKYEIQRYNLVFAGEEVNIVTKILGKKPSEKVLELCKEKLQNEKEKKA